MNLSLSLGPTILFVPTAFSFTPSRNYGRSVSSRQNLISILGHEKHLGYCHKEISNVSTGVLED